MTVLGISCRRGRDLPDVTDLLVKLALNTITNTVEFEEELVKRFSLLSKE